MVDVRIEENRGDHQPVSARPPLTPWTQQPTLISTSVEHRLSRLEEKVDALLSPQREPSVRSNRVAESPFEAADDFQGKFRSSLMIRM